MDTPTTCRRLRRPFVALFTFLAACASAPHLALQARRAVFDDAWRTIGEKHFDPAMGGVDWAAVRAKYAPQVDAARSDAELAHVLQAMVGELHHSHVAVFPPESDHAAETAAAAPNASAAAARGTPGLAVAWIDEQVVVTRIDADGAAAAAGVRPGETLLAIDGAPLSRLTAAARRRGGEHWTGYVPYAVGAQLQGPLDTPVRLQLAALDGTVREIAVPRRAPALPPMELGNLGSLDAEFDSQLLDGNVLYVRFSPCFVPLQEQVEQALQAHRDAAGVILDLRDNPGGLGALAMGIARHFLRDERELGTMRLRGADEPLRFKVNPSENPYAGPLVVLVNGSSGSTAEILAAGLQKIGRARIVGQTSMGAALPSVIEAIAHGWRVQAVVADFTLPDGSSVEGRGVVPDVVVSATRADYAAAVDPFVALALRELPNAPRLADATAAAPTAMAAPTAERAPCTMDAEMRELFTRMCNDPSAQRLAAAKTLRITSRLELMGMAGPNVTTIQAPDKVHSLGSLPGTGELLQVFDGERAWSRNAFEGLRELTGEELAAFRRSARLDPQAWVELFAKMEIVEKVRDGDRDCIVVKQTPHAGDGEPIVLKLDAATLLPYHSSTVMRSRMGAMPVATDFVDYGDFDGVRLPKRSVSKLGGATMTTVTERLELDVPVDPALFGKPAPAAKRAPKSGTGG